MKESKLQHDVRLHLGQKPDLVIWRNNVGRVHNPQSDNWIQYGLCPGSSDIIGILCLENGFGIFFALELKAAKGRESEEQKRFRDLVQLMGGYAGVARSVEEAEAHYNAARSLGLT